MEANEIQLSSYYHHQHQHQHQHQQQSSTACSPTNGLLPNTDGSHLIYPHSVPSAVSSHLEPAKRKRGRPRKYGTPEQALAAKKSASSSSHSFSPRCSGRGKYVGTSITLESLNEKRAVTVAIHVFWNLDSWRNAS
ncbi:AT-hook motif nuclear-localized protein 14 [Senna tora]|uniref:AT-hook motif nuclear-localized protein 14 n=1 Tax=Senna tora TaxID=362788 RepID=A0A834SKU0_9FABA|nr:AT-hook motif nuclear-localized protein 14 [Senna tora]